MIFIRQCLIFSINALCMTKKRLCQMKREILQIQLNVSMYVNHTSTKVVQVTNTIAASLASHPMRSNDLCNLGLYHGYCKDQRNAAVILLYAVPRYVMCAMIHDLSVWHNVKKQLSFKFKAITITCRFHVSKLDLVYFVVHGI